ncbi:hypothetical protein HanXRQr2_Chr16g0744841 [Helianthus annuus]|uniref:Uncharacterized protein n=1 Tax=Helianthus annuus TaxID=4232 RepID=A0A9K3GXX9_HELAN|nr:hypothetical protein HanXRQr2_Chr16g0744841 [Helianthus annuus]KAJ0820946.1 hypothetical protein HanPSC8_Chr16g0714151 [Helianthus annuus]
MCRCTAARFGVLGRDAPTGIKDLARFPAALVSEVIRGLGNVTLSWTSHSP